jgi:hypothetical protein
MTGSGMQQARSTRVEQAVKAVRNRGGGTGPGQWYGSAERALGLLEWTPGV